MNAPAESDWLQQAPPETVRRAVDALYRVHALLPVTTDLVALLERIVDEGLRVAEAEAGSIMLYDPEQEDLYFHVARGGGSLQTLQKAVRLPLGEGLAGRSALERRPIHADDVRNEPAWSAAADNATDFSTRSLLAVPLIERDELIGVLEFVNKRGGQGFTGTDLRISEMFGALAASAIAHARLVEAHLQSERMAGVGRAVAGLSHYIKNIVTGMNSSMDLVQTGLDTGSQGLIQRAWPMVRRSADRLTHCVQDMLAFSKPRKPARRPADVSRLLTDVAETCGNLAASHGVEVGVEDATAAAAFPLDETSMYRAVLNLAANAVDAAGENGRVMLRATHTATGLALTVEDSGPGVAPDERKRVFDPFYSTKGSAGTGLGLAVTRKAAAEHGGTVEIGESALGGALFRVTIPHHDALTPGTAHDDS
jgi:signal transduction histidine kinase